MHLPKHIFFFNFNLTSVFLLINNNIKTSNNNNTKTNNYYYFYFIIILIIKINFLSIKKLFYIYRIHSIINNFSSNSYIFILPSLKTINHIFFL